MLIYLLASPVEVTLYDLKGVLVSCIMSGSMLLENIHCVQICCSHR